MKSFSQIFCQAAPVEWLRGAIASRRLPHALIFAGPAGVGKATTARAVAARFLCEKPLESEACGACASCKLMEAETHPDFHVVYRQLIRHLKKDSVARDLAIDVIREFLNEPAGRTSVMNVGKVFMIEEAELMNAAAQNALLKTLEEPSPKTLIILLTDQPASLYPTIRSRCQMLRFAEVDPAIVRRELLARGVAADRSEAAAKFAEGSLGVALRWLDNGVIERAEQLESHLETLLDGTAPKHLSDWLKQSADDFAGRVLKADKDASKDQATREGLVLYLTLAGQFFRRALKTSEDPEFLEAACAAIVVVARAQEYIEANVNVAVALQQAAMALSGLFASQIVARR